MSTDRADYSSSSAFEALPHCCGCQQPLPPQATFCPACGVRQPPQPDSAPRLPLAIARQPVIQDGEKMEARLLRAQKLANSLILFPQSGALPPLIEPQEGPQRPGWMTPASLPEWLEGARAFSTRQTETLHSPATPDWLNSSGRTHPPFPEKPTPAPEEMPSGPDWRDTLKDRALPHLPEPGPVKPEPYLPLPDGTIPCPTCQALGTLYSRDAPHQRTCPTCRGKRRVQAAVPQPAPALQPEEAAITGPTDVALEAVQIVPPAKLPQTTDPIPEIHEQVAREEAAKQAIRAQRVDMRRALISKLTGFLQWQETWIGTLEFYEETVTKTAEALAPDARDFSAWHMVGNCYSELIEHLHEAQVAADLMRGWLLEAGEAGNA